MIAVGPARAADELGREMAEVAKQVKKSLADRQNQSIAVGEFTGPARMTSSGGPGIKHALVEELKRNSIRVERKADLELKGDYFDAQDKETNLLTLVVQVRLIDRAGNEVNQIKRQIFNVATIGSILGTTVQLPPDADDKTREQKLVQEVDDPHPQIDGTRVAAGPGSPYAVEVLVKSKDKYDPRAPQLDDGLAFVPIKRDEIYAIRLINNSSDDAAVTLTIDGLSVFAFSEVKDPKTGRPQFTHMIVPAHSSGTVPGWHITNDQTDSFQITEYAKSAAAELSSTGEIGTITASFAAAWPKGAPPPADEADAASRQQGRSGDATGRGPRIGVQYQPVERDLGKVRAMVSIRYTKQAELKL
jgi:hypothetical protein